MTQLDYHLSTSPYYKVWQQSYNNCKRARCWGAGAVSHILALPVRAVIVALRALNLVVSVLKATASLVLGDRKQHFRVLGEDIILLCTSILELISGSIGVICPLAAWKFEHHLYSSDLLTRRAYFTERVEPRKQFRTGFDQDLSTGERPVAEPVAADYAPPLDAVAADLEWSDREVEDVCVLLQQLQQRVTAVAPDVTAVVHEALTKAVEFLSVDIQEKRDQEFRRAQAELREAENALREIGDNRDEAARQQIVVNQKDRCCNQAQENARADAVRAAATEELNALIQGRDNKVLNLAFLYVLHANADQDLMRDFVRPERELGKVWDDAKRNWATLPSNCWNVWNGQTGGSTAQGKLALGLEKLRHLANRTEPQVAPELYARLFDAPFASFGQQGADEVA